MFRDHPKDQLLLVARAMANIVASDHEVTHDERLELDGVIEGIGLSPNDEQVTRAVEAELARPGPILGIVSGIAARDLRVALLRMMTELACSDGHVAEQERARVVETAAAFGIDRALADELFAWTMASVALEQREEELMEKLLG